MEIKYSADLTKLTANSLCGYFVGWPNCPTPDKHLQILHASYAVVLAFEGDRCVGFINAISDGLFSAYLPLLEVLPEYQGRGIGKQLVLEILTKLSGLYSIDVVCDPKLESFYQQLGLTACVGMAKRNYENQQGPV